MPQLPLRNLPVPATSLSDGVRGFLQHFLKQIQAIPHSGNTSTKDCTVLEEKIILLFSKVHGSTLLDVEFFVPKNSLLCGITAVHVGGALTI